jgi:hypothetical protein
MDKLPSIGVSAAARCSTRALEPLGDVMPIGLFGSLAALGISSVGIPFAYCYLWPKGATRPGMLISVAIPLGLAVGVVAFVWAIWPLSGVSLSGLRPGEAPDSAFDNLLRSRLVLATAAAIVLQVGLSAILAKVLGK